MTHVSSHVIAAAIIGGLDSVRGSLTVRQCALVDRLKDQDQFSGRDKRLLLRCAADVLFEDDDE